ncbi:uncharacterized protein LOC107370977 [Tetranychus urticae]|uniref:BACK domain-containing protein n=1 Tax=Tetranychus urticae TaxID=32264 RepID=T1JYA6_TETUR|nr:uncharacterized protein LOC107370977 [Tetranychus urticae]
MNSLKTDDKLTIVNGTMEHRISKKIIRKVPYFDRMLSHDLLESKENKVKLDFDERALKLILNWLEFGLIFIEMDNVINLCTIADYFGVNNYLIDDCISHFHDNFSIEHLPVVIPQVTQTSKLINSGALNAFIRRYFMKIANTTVWLDYPIETIAYICKLDLMIYSEIQVFDSIMKWINFKADSRKCYLKELFKLIRWFYLEDKDLSKIKENELVKSCNFELELCSHDSSNCNYTIDRTKQSYFVVLEESDDKDLRVKVLDHNFIPLINRVIQSDESMLLNLLHDEHTSDIFFDSGRKMIRIDWKQNKYRLLKYLTLKSYYPKIYRCFFEDQKSEAYGKEMLPKYYGDHKTKGSLVEANDKFILVCHHEYWLKCWTNPTTEIINSHFDDTGYTYLTTVLDNSIYMIKNNFEFFQFNIDSKLEYKKVEIDRLKHFKIYNLLLTSNLACDDKVIIIDKSTKAVYCYNVETDKWSSMGRISNCDSESADGQRISDQLLTFTSTLLSMDTIKSTMNMN